MLMLVVLKFMFRFTGGWKSPWGGANTWFGYSDENTFAGLPCFCEPLPSAWLERSRFARNICSLLEADTPLPWRPLLILASEVAPEKGCLFLLMLLTSEAIVVVSRLLFMR